jgi:hypothetical protein
MVSDERRPYRDKETLQKKYWDEGKSCYEVADELDCGYQTVLNWLEKTGLGTRKSTQEKPPHYRMINGYEAVESKVNGATNTVLIHRLLAVAEGLMNPSDFGDEKTVVHHKNGVRWDNRPSNIEVLSDTEHMRHHMKNRDRDENGRVI